jgi:hypothetical protein
MCLERLNEDNSSHPTVPRSYIDNYERSKPLWLATIGFSGHGKTSYLGSLSLLLDNADKFWKNSSVRYLDPYTTENIQDAHKIIYDRKVFEKTRKWGESNSETGNQVKKATNPPRPLLIKINAVPEFDSRCLVLYDAAGEYFETLTGIPDAISQSSYIKSLKAVRTIWFMVSLPDLASPENRRSKSLRDLFDSYITGMERMGWDTKGRNLIVVYTKADKLKNVEHVPSVIRNYLFEDKYGPLVGKINYADPNTFYQGVEREKFDMNEYISKMEFISKELEEYTKNLAGGSAFLNLAEDYGLKVYFTITSALGTDLQDGEAITNFTSYRVLDPLLWALKLDAEPPIPTTIKIILDTNYPAFETENKGASNPVYSLPFEFLMPELGKIGDEVITYYLGRNKSCAPSGQKPPAVAPKQKYPRLLRPLLSDLESNTLALIFTNGQIEDLDDFFDIESGLYDKWKNRLFVVSLSKKYESPWRWTVDFNPRDQPDIIINQFRRMLQDSKREGE